MYQRCGYGSCIGSAFYRLPDPEASKNGREPTYLHHKTHRLPSTPTGIRFVEGKEDQCCGAGAASKFLPGPEPHKNDAAPQH
jgi:hypothetical protein